MFCLHFVSQNTSVHTDLIPARDYHHAPNDSALRMLLLSASQCFRDPTCTLLSRSFVRCVSIFPWSSLKAASNLNKISITTSAYAGCPLSKMTPSLRGKMLETVARRVFERHRPNSITEDPIPGLRCDGIRRGMNCAEYDWLCDGRRVQCKSAQLSWDKGDKGWRVNFHKMIPCLFDELILVLYTPFQLRYFTYCWKRDLSAGEARARKSLTFWCQRKVLDRRQAEDVVCEKIVRSGAGQCLATLQTSDELVVEALQQQSQSAKSRLEGKAYAQHPLNYLTPSARGLLVEEMVYEVDLQCHPCYGHADLAPYNSPCDWHRDGLRVECKHTRLKWTASNNNWECNFQGVMFSKFDLLYLALDSPRALHILRFGGSKWIRNGKAITVRGRTGEVCPSAAAETILEKLVSSGSEHVASVVW